MTRLATDKIIGAVVLGFGLAAAALSMSVGSQMWGGESARLFPLGVALILAALGAFLIWKGTGRYTLGDEAVNVLILVAVGLTYIWAINKLGYHVATGFTGPFVFWVFGVRSIPGLAACAVLCPLVFHLIFFIGLGVFPPFGEWFDLLDIIRGL